MEPPIKGQVTPLASMFPAEDAQKAAKRVDEAIAEKQKELDHLKGFIADNSNLINLVSRLPDELHHDIMVPFGKAAFFPGRLIHTNEFMVLLGEGYYAERTAKQTVEILKRRGKGLESQVDSLKANIKDLRAEASFFDSTASEAAEGLVEIREDYVEESSSESQSKSADVDGKKVTVKDDEYDRIMSRLDELEQEELAAERGNNSDEDEDEDEDEGEDEEEDAEEDEEHNDTDEIDNESDEDEQTTVAKRKSNADDLTSNIQSVIQAPQGKMDAQNATVELLSNKFSQQLDITDESNCTGLTVQPVCKDDMQNGTSVTQGKKSVRFAGLPEVKEKFERNEPLIGTIVEKSSNIQTSSQYRTTTPSQTPGWSSTPGFDSSKAFTGSIVERTHNLPTEKTSTSSQPSDSQPTRPVSRFKMQRK